MAAVDLGPLKKLRIRHDNTHSYSSWYLDRVEIVDTKDDTTSVKPTESFVHFCSVIDTVHLKEFNLI